MGSAELFSTEAYITILSFFYPFPLIICLQGPQQQLLSLPGHLKLHKHPYTNKKIQEWSLDKSKDILVVGDSNLACIQLPQYLISRYQCCRQKLSPHPNTQKVILPAGLKNCIQKQEPTISWKQLGLQQSLQLLVAVFIQLQSRE